MDFCSIVRLRSTFCLATTTVARGKLERIERRWEREGRGKVGERERRRSNFISVI